MVYRLSLKHRPRSESNTPFGDPKRRLVLRGFKPPTRRVAGEVDRAEDVLRDCVMGWEHLQTFGRGSRPVQNNFVAERLRGAFRDSESSKTLHFRCGELRLGGTAPVTGGCLGSCSLAGSAGATPEWKLPSRFYMFYHIDGSRTIAGLGQFHLRTGLSCSPRHIPLSLLRISPFIV